MTEKLYETDSYVQVFTATVLACTEVSGGYAVVLDEKGRAVRDAGELAPGEVVTLRVNRGQATAKVLERSGSDGGEKTEL